MNKSRKVVILSLAAIAVAALAAWSAQAFTLIGPNIPVKVQYAAKFVCGKWLPDGQVGPGPVKPGNYATAVNIHNPSFSKVAVIAKKAVIALREPEEGRPSEFVKMNLSPNSATEADCPDIRQILDPQAHPADESFIKGFLVIYSQSELDVVSVYTAQSLDANGKPTGMSIDVENVPVRRAVN